MIDDARLRYPFSRPVGVANVSDRGESMVVAADAAERQAVAALNDLVRIDDLRGDFRLMPESRHGLHVTGAVKAAVIRTCVVTMEEFEVKIDETVDVRFAPAEEVEARASGHRALPEEERLGAELPDEIVDGRIDLGALTAEFLALALDPYPKKPGAEFAEPMPPEESAEDSPFATLASLKPGQPH